MVSTESQSEYLARAEMHEELAAATDDVPARRMHLAMAATYRQKAAEMGAIQAAVKPESGPILKCTVAAR